MDVYNICRMIKYITLFCHDVGHDLNAYHYFIIISGSTLMTQSESVGTSIRGPEYMEFANVHGEQQPISHMKSHFHLLLQD